MPKAKEKQIPKRVQKVIDRCRSGETLCRSYRPRAIGETNEVLIWWFEPSGVPCASISAQDAVKTGQIIPCDTGLFGDNNAQSFAATGAS